MIGKTLGNFQCTTLLGKGGMGEVYRAKDQKLGRDVAIKVLPEEFVRDADRVARFQREAKLLASLNHPNIAAIHGLEEADGTHFLVLELIEGDTLADRIKSDPIPVEEALKLALQIAEALEAAHEKGVIHRDLKPANIKVTPNGKVKVLDFGLAKAFAGGQEVNLSNSPTLSDAATQQGVILGTAAYMSPEQARGKSVDKRADIWAFGCVLFEMLSGRAAFPGRDVTDILAAVIRSEPEWSILPADLHWRLREVIERCLKKETGDRYHDIADVKADIQRVLADPGGVLTQAIVMQAPQRKLRAMLPWAMAVLGIIIAAAVVWNLRKPEPRQVMRFDYDLPAGQEFGNLSFPALAISPDGKHIAYSTAKGLFLRSINELSAKLIPGTEGITAQPFFSPDGKWIGYFSFSDLKLKKIDINGGAPVALCGASPTGVTGIDWSADDTIIYGMAPGNIMRVSANGGTPEPIVKVKTAVGAYPQMLPDGKSILYTTASPQPTIAVHSIETGVQKTLFAGIAARYVPTGHIVYGLSNNSNLFAVPFDLDKLEATGGAVPVVEGVVSPMHFAVSSSGTLVYIPGTAVTSNQRTLVWVDRTGKEEPIPIQAGDYAAPKISPDGKKIALTAANGEKSDIWIWDIVRETMTRLTFNESSSYALWNQEGSRIAFMKGSAGAMVTDVYWKAADGTGNDENLSSGSDRVLLPWSWSKDGKTLALFEAELSEGVNYDIGTLSVEGSHERKPLLNQKYIEFQPKISPDGKWLAYASNESGELQIYVRPFPDVNSGRWQVSAAGGGTPLWSPDGRELFYLNGGAAMRVSVETEPTFKAGKPEILFRGRYVGLSTSDGQPWDISPDGRRFLMLKPYVSEGTASAGAAERPKINIVLNWFEELKQRVPVK